MDKVTEPGNTYLKVLSYLGDFSLDIQADQIKFKKIQILKTLGFGILSSIAMNHFTIAEFFEKGILWSFIEFLEGLGFVPIDFIVGALMINITAASAWINHFLLYKKRIEIEKFLKHYVRFKDSFSNEKETEFIPGGSFHFSLNIIFVGI